MEDARTKIDAWRHDYNDVRTHSALGIARHAALRDLREKAEANTRMMTLELGVAALLDTPEVRDERIGPGTSGLGHLRGQVCEARWPAVQAALLVAARPGRGEAHAPLIVGGVSVRGESRPPPAPRRRLQINYSGAGTLAAHGFQGRAADKLSVGGRVGRGVGFRVGTACQRVTGYSWLPFSMTVSPVRRSTR